MLDEGAGTRSALEIAEELEQLGADLYVGAGRDGSQLTLQVPSQELRARAGHRRRRRCIRPRLDPSDWARVQHDRLTALAQRRDQPEAVAERACPTGRCSGTGTPTAARSTAWSAA